jgi:shikimate kinase
MRKVISRIFLVGPAGAGKSTIGSELATRLGMKFIDTDREVESRCGVSLSWIYDVEGEAGFRRRETQALTELVKEPNTVLATGGDIVICPENRKLLSSNGFVVYLATSLGDQLERTRSKEHRPKLQVENLEDRLVELREELLPLYEDIADVSFDTQDKSVRYVAKLICQHLADH